MRNARASWGRLCAWATSAIGLTSGRVPEANLRVLKGLEASTGGRRDSHSTPESSAQPSSAALQRREPGTHRAAFAVRAENRLLTAEYERILTAANRETIGLGTGASGRMDARF